MKISILIEGKTEKAFMPHLKKFLDSRLPARILKLDPVPYDGRIPTDVKLKRVVCNLLNDRRSPADIVIALTDVYTGSYPPDFDDAQDAKNKMRNWVGNEPRFHPHAAQFDFEAWLLPYWSTIQRLAGHNRTAPSGNPEAVNHDKPPSYRIKEIFEIGRCRDSYVKWRDADKILSENDLSVAATSCSELKALINTVLTACGGLALP